MNALIKNPKQLHPTSFECKNKYNKPFFETAYLGENVKKAQVKISQTVKFHPFWGQCYKTFLSVIYGIGSDISIKSLKT